jgi:hypothetical protein
MAFLERNGGLPAAPAGGAPLGGFREGPVVEDAEEIVPEPG